MKKYRVLAIVALAAVIAFARPIAFLAQEAGKAADILTQARKAIGDTRLDSLKTFTLQSTVQRNTAGRQMTSDVEIFLEMPDKYARIENMSGGPGVFMVGGGTTGFNGSRALQKVAGGAMPGGVSVMQFAGPIGMARPGSGEKPTPEQQQQMNDSMVRSSRNEASRLMLGWFAMAHPAANATYTYAGEAESAEGRAYVVDVKNNDGLDVRLFIDTTTHLPLMVAYKAPQPRVITQSTGTPGSQATSSNAHVVQGSSRPMSDDDRKKAMSDVERQIKEAQSQPATMVDYALFFDEWRDVDGIKFPFKVRRAMAGETTEEWKISKVKLNPKIDAKKFAVDSGS